MAEYISRDDALLHSEIIRVYSKDYGNIDVVPVEYLADIPAAEVQPVKRGRWIDCTFYDPYEKSYEQNFEYKCSCCGHMIYNKPNDDNQYCGHCGAPMFFCGKAKPTEDYQPTNGDIIRNMTDRQLAERQNTIEHTAYIHGRDGGYMTFGKGNIDFLTGWLGTPDGEDYEP